MICEDCGYSFTIKEGVSAVIMCPKCGRWYMRKDVEDKE